MGLARTIRLFRKEKSTKNGQSPPSCESTSVTSSQLPQVLPQAPYGNADQERDDPPIGNNESQNEGALKDLENSVHMTKSNDPKSEASEQPTVIRQRRCPVLRWEFPEQEFCDFHFVPLDYRGDIVAAAMGRKAPANSEKSKYQELQNKITVHQSVAVALETGDLVIMPKRKRCFTTHYRIYPLKDGVLDGYMINGAARTVTYGGLFGRRLLLDHEESLPGMKQVHFRYVMTTCKCATTRTDRPAIDPISLPIWPRSCGGPLMRQWVIEQIMRETGAWNTSNLQLNFFCHGSFVNRRSKFTKLCEAACRHVWTCGDRGEPATVPARIHNPDLCNNDVNGNNDQYLNDSPEVPQRSVNDRVKDEIAHDHTIEEVSPCEQGPTKTVGAPDELVQDLTNSLQPEEIEPNRPAAESEKSPFGPATPILTTKARQPARSRTPSPSKNPAVESSSPKTLWSWKSRDETTFGTSPFKRKQSAVSASTRNSQEASKNDEEGPQFSIMKRASWFMRSVKHNRNASVSNKPSSSKSAGSQKSSRQGEGSEPRVGEEHIYDAVPVVASASESDNMTRSTQSTRSLLAAMDMIEETETS